MIAIRIHPVQKSDKGDERGINFSDFSCVISRKLRDTFGQYGRTIAGSQEFDKANWQ
jgi:hypothetical protein